MAHHGRGSAACSPIRLRGEFGEGRAGLHHVSTDEVGRHQLSQLRPSRVLLLFSAALLQSFVSNTVRSVPASRLPNVRVTSKTAFSMGPESAYPANTTNSMT
jgi:hypothetical protein